jgi:hypothetical protein
VLINVPDAGGLSGHTPDAQLGLVERSGVGPQADLVPVAVFSAGRIWRRADVEAWARDTGRLP